MYLRPGRKPTPYKIWSGIKPTVKYFKTFGSKCYFIQDREHLGKFNSRSDERTFHGYSLNMKVYRVFHLKSFVVMEAINVVVDDI